MSAKVITTASPAACKACDRDVETSQSERKMLSLSEAANELGYSAKGLRKIVDRSRRKSQGEYTHGPTIKFYQAGRGGAIKFRLEWLEEFIDKNTIDPNVRVTPSPNKQRPKCTTARQFEIHDTSGLDEVYFGLAV